MGARKKKGRKQKNRAYFMRFCPKMRRRRTNKTDYQARRVLITQQKNKYNVPKYRFVVRITNKDIICQIVSSEIIGDKVHCAAFSHELPRYGMKVGLTNYAACYATGLLLARRLLKLKGLDKQYEGNDEINGEHYLAEVEDAEQNGPFEAFLDVGLRRTTTGARVYAAMKGAVDGGLYVPHNETGKQFPGWEKTEDGENFDAATLQKYIFAGHVGEYMEKLKEEDEDKYNKHFSRYIANNWNSENLEEKIREVHSAIRADPSAAPKKENVNKTNKYKNKAKYTRAQRRDHVVNKILVARRAK